MDVLLPLLPNGPLTMVMDRTTWHYGQTPLNILVLGGVVLPLIWTVLPHQGNVLGRTAPMRTLARSSGAARILLVARLLKVLPAKRWAVLIADREFVGKDWCVYLRWKGIKRCFWIKENTRIDDLLAKEQFQDLQPGEVRSVFEKAWVYGTWMRVVVTLSPAGDRVIVASDLSVLDILFTYKTRWSGMHLFGDEGPWAGTRRHPHDGSGQNLPAVRSALYRAGLDDPGWGSSAGSGPADAGQPGAESQKYGEDRMDTPQSGGALGMRHVLDVPGPLENSFSLSRRGKSTKYQLLRAVPPCRRICTVFSFSRSDSACKKLKNLIRAIDKRTRYIFVLIWIT